MNSSRAFVPAFALLLILANPALAQGPLAPPGAPAPTMKSLEQVEPRIPIDSLPMVITSAGSYYVVSNLTGVAGQHGITVNADGVSIDLNGFTLRGVPGSRSGIFTDDDDVSVYNGVFRGWGEHGIDALTSKQSRFRDVHASENAGVGIRAGEGAMLESCSAYENGGDGLFGNSQAILDHCSARGNGGFGIHAFAAIVRACVSMQNTNSGIFAAGAVVSHSRAVLNAGHGIEAVQEGLGLANRAAVVENCIVSNNDGNGIFLHPGSAARDCLANRNGEHGILASNDCRVVSCVVKQNFADGIHAWEGTTVRDCTANDNDGNGIVGRSQTRLRDNECHANVNAAGMVLEGSSGRLEGNHVTGNDVGLFVTGTNHLVSGNTVLENQGNYDLAGDNQLELLLCELPQAIDWPARVTLAGSLIGPSSGNGITVNAPGVTIDLAGHRLTGGGGAGSGIDIPVGGSGATVRNGTIANWGGFGINAAAATNVCLEGVSLSGNQLSGCLTADNAVVTGCKASANGQTGIFLGVNSMVRDCFAEGNGDHGIRILNLSLVQGCVANRNGESGILISTDCTAVDCVANDNGENGIDAASDCRVERNSCSNNGTDTADGAGIRLDGSDTLCRDNYMEGNQLGLRVSMGDILIVGNVAARNSTNYFFTGLGATGTDYGEIYTEPGANFTNSNPWANFEQIP